MKWLNEDGLRHFWGCIKEKLSQKQDSLVSGTNLKTVDGQSLLGSGDVKVNTYHDITGSNAQTLMSLKAGGIPQQGDVNTLCEHIQDGLLENKTIRVIHNGVIFIFDESDCVEDASIHLYATLSGEENVLFRATYDGTNWNVQVDGILLQPKLISGTDIKTVLGKTLLGTGNVVIDDADIVYDGEAVNILSTAASVRQALDDLDAAITDLGTPNEIASITTSASSVSGGNNAVTITETNGTETTFIVKNGTDGANGVSLGDVEIADNLTTDDNTKVLSAKQGKRLNDVLSTIKGTSQINYTHETEDFWISGKYWKGNGVGQTASFGVDSSSNYSIPVPVKKGDVISYRGGGYGYVIVTCDSAGANAKCLVASPSTYGTADAPDVTIAEDGYVSFGFRKPTATYTCAIKITRNIDKIADLEAGVSQNAEDIETLNSAVESIEEQLTDDTFPMQRMYPLFWKTANTYQSTDWQVASRYDLLTDLIAIPDGISKMKITLESGDGTPLTELYPSIYFYDANLEPTDASSNHEITLNEDKNIPSGSKWYKFKFGYNTPNSIYRAMLPSFMQTKFILHAPMTQEQYDNKFMQSYEDGRQQLHTYDWDDLKLTTACMAGYGVASRKDFQLAIMTDSHGNHLYVDNMLRSANEHKTIDAIVHCGDWQPSTYNQPASRKQFIELFSKSTKPVYVAIGNHDHGYNYVSMCASQKMLYNDIVAPMVANGWLVVGEYTENKCYFYHDFVDDKVRLIVLYDYDNDDLAENEYWEPVTYDPNAEAFQYSHTYTYNASSPTIVNCGEYNEFSFKLKKSVTTAGSGAPYQRDATIPCMAVDWQSRIFSQQQAQWLANTLLSTPANFKVVIASHQPFSLNVTLQNKKFSQFNIYNPNISNWHAEHIATDFLAACVDAFQRGVAFDHKVVMQGLASYLNTQTSGGLSYAYEVTANFANKNSGATFMCFIGGHCHPDLIWKHNTYTQWGVYAIATRNNAGSGYDILDLSSPDYPNCNHWTAIALGKKNATGSGIDRKIGLARVGKDLTVNLTRRDVEFIDTSE